MYNIFWRAVGENETRAAELLVLTANAKESAPT
jgi:hypothetical protein